MGATRGSRGKAVPAPESPPPPGLVVKGRATAARMGGMSACLWKERTEAAEWLRTGERMNVVSPEVGGRK